ncbi:MAG TPA: medium chain dehydrogenase/reductase family protein [Acidobacteriota bacterium]|nr:medium chain dehydrogenase/reductase family protein [Acidobacteriota bacterium]
MRAIRYVKSVPRYLTARYLGRRFPSLYTSGWAALQYVDIEPQPLPSPRWTRVRPSLSGICGSDLASLTAEGSAYFSPFTPSPFVFGHEVVGEVIECGAQVDRFKTGDRVILQPPLTCRVRQPEQPCSYCLGGNDIYCHKIDQGVIGAGLQTGFCQDTGGGWSDSFVAHELQLHAAPADLPDEIAVLAEPFSCSLHAANRAPLKDDKRILVIGCGTMGALTLAAIRSLGCKSHVTVVAKHPHQQELARRLGADIVIGTGSGFYSEIAEIYQARSFQPELGGPVFLGGADLCFDCIGSSRTIDDALRLTDTGGAVMLVGMPGIPKNVDWTAIWFKELTVTSSYTCHLPLFARAIDEVGKLRQELEGFVGAVYALEDYRKAIHCALNTGSSKVLKTAFRVHPP